MGGVDGHFSGDDSIEVTEYEQKDLFLTTAKHFAGSKNVQGTSAFGLIIESYEVNEFSAEFLSKIYIPNKAFARKPERIVRTAIVSFSNLAKDKKYRTLIMRGIIQMLKGPCKDPRVYGFLEAVKRNVAVNEKFDSLSDKEVMEL